MKHTILARTLLTTALLMAGSLLLPVAPAYSESAEEARLRDLADSDLAHSDVRELLTQGTNPNVPGFMNLTAVHAAAAACAKQNLAVLLKHGGDVTVRDTDGNTPLHHAVGGIAVDLACAPSTRLLVQHDAPLNQANQDGNTALHLAAKRTREDSLAVLLDAGANPRAVNGDGLTPLQLFVKAGVDQGRIVALLVDAGADPNRKTPEGYTPLHLTLKAVGSHGKTAVVEALLAGNADPCIRDPEEYIPSQYGKVHEKENVVLREALDRAGGGELTCGKQEIQNKPGSSFITHAELPFDHFFELVGIDCEKATLQMTFGEVDDISTCLETQHNLIFDAWTKLKAEGKVVTSPELKATVIKLANDFEQKQVAYVEYYNNQLPDHPTNAQWSAWKHKEVEWMNAYNDYNMKLISLMDEEIKAYTEKKSIKNKDDLDRQPEGDEYNADNEFKGYN